jgi:nitroreductase
MIFQYYEKEINIENEEYCIFCGHCISVCPDEAIRHEKLNYKEFQDISEEKISPSLLKALFQERRSIRRFKKKEIPQQQIQEIIEMSRFAPTGSNAQNVKFLVLQGESIPPFVTLVREFYGQILELLQESSVESKTMLRRMRKWKHWLQEAEKEKDAIFYDPSTVIVIYAPSDDSLSPLNSGFVTSYLMLAAQVYGLGTCNIGYALEAIKRRPEIAEHLGIPEDEQVFSVLALGFPSLKYQRTPLRNPPQIKWK